MIFWFKMFEGWLGEVKTGSLLFVIECMKTCDNVRVRVRVTTIDTHGKQIAATLRVSVRRKGACSPPLSCGHKKNSSVEKFGRRTTICAIKKGDDPRNFAQEMKLQQQ